MNASSLALIGSGGFVGAVLRHAISSGIQIKSDFTLGVFIANVLGCFIAGILISLGDLGSLSAFVVPALSIGFCGALTTFSTYILDILVRFETDRVGMSFLILFATICGCFVLVFTGNALSSRFLLPFLRKSIL